MALSGDELFDFIQHGLEVPFAETSIWLLAATNDAHTDEIAIPNHGAWCYRGAWHRSVMHERASSSAIDHLATSLIDVAWVPSPVAAIPLALVRFFRDQCIQWGAALGYYTLIGLIPLLTATFSILKGFGLHHGLTPFVVSTVGAGSPQVSRQIVEFIDRTNVRAVGTVSVIAAVLAVFVIVGNAEMCFNRLWGGVQGRPLKRKLATYAKIAILTPLALLATLALTAALQPGSRSYAFFDSLYLGDVVLTLLRLLPYAVLWFGFTLIYTRLPNTTVRLRYAIWGAMVAGTLWQLAQWTYVTFVIRLVRHSAVYGALWQIPILLAWLYIAWLIVLSGAEVCRTYDDVVVERERVLERACPHSASGEANPDPRTA